MIDHGLIHQEKKKYLELFSLKGEELKLWYEHSGRRSPYGAKNWGHAALPLVDKLQIQSICDVGCGRGNFCDDLTHLGVNPVFGVDIASVAANAVIDNPRITFIDADITNIPLSDEVVDFVSSFDCLEHLPEPHLDAALKECRRIAKRGFLLSISNEECIMKDWRGVETRYHLTVQNSKWWTSLLETYGTVLRYKQYYLVLL